jgi:hypothetical protein
MEQERFTDDELDQVIDEVTGEWLKNADLVDEALIEIDRAGRLLAMAISKMDLTPLVTVRAMLRDYWHAEAKKEAMRRIDAQIRQNEEDRAEAAWLDREAA